MLERTSNVKTFAAYVLIFAGTVALDWLLIVGAVALFGGLENNCPQLGEPHGLQSAIKSYYALRDQPAPQHPFLGALFILFSILVMGAAISTLINKSTRFKLYVSGLMVIIAVLAIIILWHFQVSAECRFEG